MIVLGIESSCDETAAALVNEKREILAETVLSQEEHKIYGGVVPEIAARSHLDHIDDVIEPRNTRFRIIRALQALSTKRLQNPPKKHSNIPL
mgnify:FL=1